MIISSKWFLVYAQAIIDAYINAESRKMKRPGASNTTSSHSLALRSSGPGLDTILSCVVRLNKLKGGDGESLSDDNIEPEFYPPEDNADDDFFTEGDGDQDVADENMV
jgi:hypothetical protein